MDFHKCFSVQRRCLNQVLSVSKESSYHGNNFRAYMLSDARTAESLLSLSLDTQKRTLPSERGPTRSPRLLSACPVLHDPRVVCPVSACWPANLLFSALFPDDRAISSGTRDQDPKQRIGDLERRRLRETQAMAVSPELTFPLGTKSRFPHHGGPSQSALHFSHSFLPLPRFPLGSQE